VCIVLILPFPQFEICNVKSEISIPTNFMQEAIRLAIAGVNAGRGGPFGAVVVQGDQIVGRGCNCVTSTNDPTAHAEVVAIRDACRSLGTFHLDGCEIYASCEPCPMCLAAIYWAHLDRLYFGATATEAAAAGFDDHFIYRQFSLPVEGRSIPAVRLMPAESLAAFEAWRVKSDRIEY
jgi:tRNA(Arg) A34 adenosine deaminase TadA